MVVDPTRSHQIRSGLRRAKRAGTPLGANGRRLAARHKQEALERAERCYPIIQEFRGSERTYREMVRVLNDRAEPTPSGRGKWRVRTLQRLVERGPAVARRLHSISLDQRVQAAIERSVSLRKSNAALWRRQAELSKLNRELVDSLHATHAHACATAQQMARLAGTPEKRGL